MINFIHRFLNPHCPHCIDERREESICDTCEILRHELEVVRLENRQLLDRILERPETPKEIDTSELKPMIPHNKSWNIRKQILEAEDRERAKLMRSGGSISTEDLEKEMGLIDSK